jgi:predicted glycosyltransferase involved in capsule biosynthesis
MNSLRGTLRTRELLKKEFNNWKMILKHTLKAENNSYRDLKNKDKKKD